MQGARVLIVDDEEGIRETLRAVLEDERCHVDTAENGQDAIAKSTAKFYNLGLVGVRLPDIDGVTLLASLGETTPKMVKIIITGYPSLESAIDAVNNGADGYIVKPFNMESLLRTIDEHLRKQLEAKKSGVEKVKEYVESRVKEQESKTSRRGRPRTRSNDIGLDVT